MRALAVPGWLVLGLIFGACAPATSAPPRPPEAAPEPPSQPSSKSAPKAERALPPPPKAVPAWSPICERFVRKDGDASATPKDSPECSARGLSAALSKENAEARDAELEGLEACNSWPPGALRALRAELADAECGDAVVADALSGSAPTMGSDVRETLLALALSARLRRLAADPPPPPAARDKAALEGYFKDTLFPWIAEQASAIHEVSRTGATLHGYAKGVVAIEAGMADMRFVEIARNVPIPREMEGDAELRDVYYASLDEALEPRKNRGRDAALVGLGHLAQVGVLRSPRLSAARVLLSRVYGAHRIDALDRLMLPPLPAASADAAPELELVRRVPTYYVPLVVPPVVRTDAAPDEASLFRAGLAQGVLPMLENELAARPKHEPTALLLAHARLELGRTYFRAEDFALVERKLQGYPSDEASFLRALATALRAGPRNAADLIQRGPRFADALGNLEALDGIAVSKSSFAGAAAFNAAYLRELVAPENEAGYWQDLAQRYKKAAQGLAGPQRKEAEASAKAAADTARAVGKR